MKNVHVHVHSGFDNVGDRSVAHATVADDADSYKRDGQGRFATSSGTGEQHAATAELHTSLAARKGTDHPHHALHMAAAEAHTEASKFLQQANKAQHPGAAIAAEHAAKKARVHENLINKGRGSTPGGEVKAQNKAMSDPRVLKENAARKAEFDEKHAKGGGKKKPATKDTADCGCGGHDPVPAGAPINKETGLFDYLFVDQSGWSAMDAIRAFIGDDWAKWNAEHKERGAKHKAIVDNKLVGKAQTALHAKAAEAHAAAHKAINEGKHSEASEHAKTAAGHEAELKAKHGYLPPPIVHKPAAGKAPVQSGSSNSVHKSVRKLSGLLMKAQKEATEADDSHKQ